METDDLIKLPACSNSEHGSETDDPCASGSEAIKSDFLPLDAKVVDEYNTEAPTTMSDGLEEDMDIATTPDVEKEVDDNPPPLPVGFEMTDAVSVEEKVVSVSSGQAENGSLSIQNEISFRSLKENESLLSKRVVDASPLSGVKRPRFIVDEEQPSVHVIYSSLPRESKQKLEELLQQWSRWHAQKCSPSHDSNIVLESGEETYFPALRVGLDKPSEVTFWMDNQTKIQSSKEFIPLDGTSIPLYDRGFSLALTSAGGSSTLDGGLEKLDTSRCFNCGSYSHALKDCPKPRDSVAVNNARKEHKSKKNQHANSRNSTRYYQSSRGGKYEGLTPGVLDVETRQLLGLGELDPPPWLNRMQELGYPPGYLDADVEDQPSGITIFGDEEEHKQESEEGEILDGSHTKTEPSRKMTVEFPGINAPIPENADETLWAPAPSSSVFPSRDRPHRRYNQSSENHSRGNYSDQRWSRDLEEDEPPPSRGHYTEPRWSREFEDDAPPGCDPLTSPSLSNHYLRYGDYDSGYYSLSPRASPSSYGRSVSDRGRRSPLVHDGSPSHGQHGNFAHSSPR